MKQIPPKRNIKTGILHCLLQTFLNGGFLIALQPPNGFIQPGGAALTRQSLQLPSELFGLLRKLLLALTARRTGRSGSPSCCIRLLLLSFRCCCLCANSNCFCLSLGYDERTFPRVTLNFSWLHFPGCLHRRDCRKNRAISTYNLCGGFTFPIYYTIGSTLNDLR